MADDFYLTMPNFVKVSVRGVNFQSTDGSDTLPTISSSPVYGGTATQWKFSRNRPNDSNYQIWRGFESLCEGWPHYFNAYTSTNEERAYFSFQINLDIDRYDGNFIAECVLNIAECQDGLHSVWWCGAPNLAVRGSNPPDDINARLIVNNTLPDRTDEVIFFDSRGVKSTHSITFSA